MDYDEFKKIKFRKDGKVYTARAVNLSGMNVMVNGNFMIWIGAFRIYDEDDKELIGKITFQQSTLLDYLWADPNQKRFPSKEFLEEALVNLLHYLPFDKETLMPDGDSFIFRFTRDLENGREKDKRIYNIKVETSLEKTYQKIMFGDKITDEKLHAAILEPLHMHRLENYATNLKIDFLRSIFPFDQNKIDSTLEFLEYKNYIEILKDASGLLISVRIKPEGVEFLSGVKIKTDNTINRIQIGHNIRINTGNNSPVNINADIDTSFDSVRKEIKEKNLPQKEDLLNDIGELQKEIKSLKDLGKIKSLVGKIGKTSTWVGRRIEPIIQQVIASYISSQLPISPLK